MLFIIPKCFNGLKDKTREKINIFYHDVPARWGWNEQHCTVVGKRRSSFRSVSRKI
jgi:hypothetical protein